MVANGQSKNAINKNASREITKTRIIKSAKITKVFINTPMEIENTTNPFLYSFFQGLKNVFARIGKDSNTSKALFNELKKSISSLGASKYQNFKKITGSFR